MEKLFLFYQEVFLLSNVLNGMMNKSFITDIKKTETGFTYLVDGVWYLNGISSSGDKILSIKKTIFLITELKKASLAMKKLYLNEITREYEIRAEKAKHEILALEVFIQNIKNWHS